MHCAHITAGIDAASQLCRFEIDAAWIEETVRPFQAHRHGHAGASGDCIDTVLHQLHAPQRQHAAIDQRRRHHIDVELALRLPALAPALRQAGDEAAFWLLVDLDDAAFDAGDAARLGIVTQVSGIERSVEMIGVGQA